MMLNRVDECRQKADECRRNAAEILADDVLRGAYLDLARLWTKMAHEAQQKETRSNTDAATIGTMTTHTHFLANIVRAGLNYKFTD